jgi:uncharacterized membrane protein
VRCPNGAAMGAAPDLVDGIPPMKALTRFVRTTILGGVFFLIPIVVLTVILAKALEYANKVLQGLAVHILAASELGAAAATAMSVVIIALVCFLAGLIARTVTAQKLINGLEASILSKVPAYEYLKQEGASALGVATMTEQPVVLVETEIGWQIGVQTEASRGGLRRCSCRERRIRTPGLFTLCLRIEFDSPMSSWSPP